MKKKKAPEPASQQARAQLPPRGGRVRETPMRSEYDFSGGVRGKYARRFKAGSNVVVLEPDVARAFPTSKAVNAALRRSLAHSPGRSAKRTGQDPA